MECARLQLGRPWLVVWMHMGDKREWPGGASDRGATEVTTVGRSECIGMRSHAATKRSQLYHAVMHIRSRCIQVQRKAQQAQGPGPSTRSESLCQVLHVGDWRLDRRLV